MFGGAALNAAHALIRTLDAADRHRRPPRRAAARRASSRRRQQELEDWKQLPGGADELADQGASPADPTAAEEFYIRTTAEPALDVNGIESGLAAPGEDGAAGARRRKRVRSPGAGPGA